MVFIEPGLEFCDSNGAVIFTTGSFTGGSALTRKREYLQCKVLEAIFESPLADKMTFMGGTYIHIVHGSSRFSEDLDFDNPGIGRHDFEALSQRVKRNLELQGYTVELKITYQNAFRASLLLWSPQLDFRRLAKDLEPFVYSKKEVNRVLMFPDFIKQAI